MKRGTIIAIILLTAGLALAAYFFLFADRPNEPTRLAAELNSRCPYSAGVAGDLLGVSYVPENNGAAISFAVNEDIFSQKVLTANDSSRADNLRLIFRHPDMQRLLKALAEARASLQITFKYPLADTASVMDLNADDMDDILGKSLTDLQANALIIKNHIIAENTDLPRQIADSMYLESTALAGGFYVCDMVFDADFYYPEDVGRLVDSLSVDKVLFMEQQFYDISSKNLLKLLSDTGFGLKYVYSDRTGRHTFELAIKPDEISDFISRNTAPTAGL